MRGQLRQSRLSVRGGHEEVNPMEGVANLADAMLVLACGLLLSLVMHWNIDIVGTEVEAGEELSETEAMQNEMTGDPSASGYEEVGSVYKDPVTGKLYLVEE